MGKTGRNRHCMEKGRNARNDFMKRRNELIK